ncbi:CD151 antigen-like [Paramacrobiotus metropolitanus]|uniref:CD151 antigen-like n=1 Tax=Paramacrobiotus metropolitanus TaxID=2943436 RepID=UPI002445A3D3|nr:CD151 antigen-like [Paramacrobiotus metropolitanus]
MFDYQFRKVGGFVIFILPFCLELDYQNNYIFDALQLADQHRTWHKGIVGVAGIFIMGIGILGATAAWAHKDDKAVRMLMALFGVTALLALLGGFQIFGIVFIQTERDLMETWTNTDLLHSIHLYKTTPNGSIQEEIDFKQSKGQCCGSQSYQDWLDQKTKDHLQNWILGPNFTLPLNRTDRRESFARLQHQSIGYQTFYMPPPSCCKVEQSRCTIDLKTLAGCSISSDHDFCDIYTEGCAPKMNAHLDTVVLNATLVIAFVFLFLELAGFIAVLCCAWRTLNNMALNYHKIKDDGIPQPVTGSAGTATQLSLETTSLQSVSTSAPNYRTSS